MRGSTVLYCTVLYCTVLYCTVLYCTVPSPVIATTSCDSCTGSDARLMQSLCFPLPRSQKGDESAPALSKAVTTASVVEVGFKLNEASVTNIGKGACFCAPAAAIVYACVCLLAIDCAIAVVVLAARVL